MIIDANRITDNFFHQSEHLYLYDHEVYVAADIVKKGVYKVHIDISINIRDELLSILYRAFRFNA